MFYNRSMQTDKFNSIRRLGAACIVISLALPRLAGAEEFHQTFEYDAPDRTPIVMSGESRAEEVFAARYCVGCDIYYTDGSLEWHFVRDFSNGTHGWERVDGVFLPPKPVKRILLYAFVREGSGKAEFRNCSIERREVSPDEEFSVRRATLRPFADADEVQFQAKGQQGMERRSRTVAAEVATPVPLADKAFVVWTADSFRLVTPLTFPGKNAAADPITFDLAGREIRSVQLLLSAGRKAGRRGLTLEIGAAKDGEGRPFKGEIGWLRQGYLKRPVFFRHEPSSAPTHESWLPDPLLPSAPFDVPSGGTQGLLVEARAAADCTAGTYRTEVIVKEGAVTVARVPVSVRVRNFALPQRFSAVTVFSTMEGYVRKVYGEGWERFRRPFQDLFLDYRLNPVDDCRTEPPRLEDMLHARERGANLHVLLNLVPKPKNPNTIWVCWTPAEELEKPEFYAYVKATLSPLWEEMKKTGLDKDAIVYGFDERRRPFYPVMEKLWRNLQRDFPGLLLRTTSKLYVDLAKGERDDLLYITDWYGPRIDVWKPSVTADLKARGKKVGFYVSEDPFYPWPGIGSYEFPLADATALFWMMYREDADAFSYWATDYWNYRCGPIDEAKTYFPDFDTWNTSRMSGDGILCYPGRQGILPSMRLTALRDGAQDFDYLKLAEAKRGRGAVLRDVAEAVSGFTEFSRDFDVYRKIRLRLADALESR